MRENCHLLLVLDVTIRSFMIEHDDFKITLRMQLQITSATATTTTKTTISSNDYYETISHETATPTAMLIN